MAYLGQRQRRVYRTEDVVHQPDLPTFGAPDIVAAIMYQLPPPSTKCSTIRGSFEVVLGCRALLICKGARYLLRKRSNLRPEEKPVKVTRYKRCGIKYENPEIVNDLYRSRGLLELIFSSLGAGIDSVTVPYPGTDPVLNLGTDRQPCGVPYQHHSTTRTQPAAGPIRLRACYVAPTRCPVLTARITHYQRRPEIPAPGQPGYVSATAATGPGMLCS
eukprot:978884-Rhodomonas_salina.2